MALPLPLDYPPMEARAGDALREGGSRQFEPKWDGFHYIAFRKGDVVALRSKSGEPLGDLVARTERGTH